MLRVTSLVLGLVLAGSLGAGAQGICPSGDTRDGVWLGFPDRTVQTRVLSDGTMEEIEFSDERSAVYVFRTLPVGLITERWGMRNGFLAPDESESVSYVGTPATIPLPVPGARYDGVETARILDGSEFRHSVSLVVGMPRPVAIGACAYTGLPIDVTRVPLDGGPRKHDSMMHLMELGMTIYLGYSEGDEPVLDEMPLWISSEPRLPGAGSAPAMMPPPPPPGAAAPMK